MSASGLLLCPCGCGHSLRPPPTAAELAGGAPRATGRPQVYAHPNCRSRAYRARNRTPAARVPHPLDPWPAPTSPGVGICGERVVLSLCDWSGEWSRPYRERGYTVVQVDLRHGADVRLLQSAPGPVHGILAAPPCTCFSRAANGTPRTREELAAALAVVDACLRFVAMCNPAWWCIENPPGKLRRWLGSPALLMEPWWYGAPYTKQTALWGRFTAPVRTVFDAPPELVSLVGEATSTAKQRSVTPSGFAAAFADANP